MTVANKEHIKRAMKSAGINTMTELANKIGISKNQLSLMLSDRYNPIKATFSELSEVLRVTPDKIIDFHKKYPNIEITIITGSTSNLIDLLDTHKVDFVVDTSPINIHLNNGMKVTKLTEVQYCFIVKKNTKILNLNLITTLTRY